MPKRDFLAISDFSATELTELFQLAAQMKSGAYTGKPLLGQTLGMIFTKSSTRTRVSFEVGAYQLGGQALTDPFRVSDRIEPGNIDDRVVTLAHGVITVLPHQRRAVPTTQSWH